MAIGSIKGTLPNSRFSTGPSMNVAAMSGDNLHLLTKFLCGNQWLQSTSFKVDLKGLKVLRCLTENTLRWEK